ncbi:MAG: hypothetical protein EOO67_10000, partial [Microbacterium sp.]
MAAGTTNQPGGGVLLGHQPHHGTTGAQVGQRLGRDGERTRLLVEQDHQHVTAGQQAGAFSVPSKTLSYLCAGRPVVGLMPEENAA